ncbi:hypothetical protein TNCV_2192931 [Trichonephila clavipes]|nr:hypothetical protein TNCV_2192931 [Trichonephila clavipes]
MINKGDKAVCVLCSGTVFEIVSKVVKRNPELCSHTCHTAAFLNFPMIRPHGKSIQMSSNRLIIRHFSLRQQLGVILTAIRRAISFARNTDLTPTTCFILLRHSPLRLPAYLRMCYRTSPYLISDWSFCPLCLFVQLIC